MQDIRKETPSHLHRLGNVCQLVIVEPLQVVFFHESVDILLDIGNFRRESVSDLIDHLFNKMNMFELLASLHDADNDGLAVLAKKALEERQPTYL